jgi:hypothetical protein
MLASGGVDQGMMDRRDRLQALENQFGGERIVFAARWPALIALISAGVTYAVLPQRLRFGPPFLLALLELLLAIPLLFSHRRGYHRASLVIGRAALSLLTLALVSSTIFLISRVPGQKYSGSELLRYAGAIWALNVVVFAVWYWEVDDGGPRYRHPEIYRPNDLVFPQFQIDPQLRAENWVPHFLDYLFLAFNTSTAFSPTDTMAISRQIKVLLMCQSLISLVIIGVLISRAINTIQ